MQKASNKIEAFRVIVLWELAGLSRRSRWLELPTFPMESGRSEPKPAYVKMKRASKEMKPFNIESCGN